MPLPHLIDAHVHFWQPSRLTYHWLPAASSLSRDFTPATAKAEMDACGVTGGIIVEAANREDEIPLLLTLSQQDTRIWGVIGWLDLLDRDVAARILKLSHSRFFKGVRLNVAEASPHPDHLAPALHVLQQLGLVVDVLTNPAQLTYVADLAMHYPDLSIVINHFGGVAIHAEALTAWVQAMRQFQALSNVALKLSGDTTLSASPPGRATLRAYLDAALGLFGPARLMFGSNYPICLRAMSYTETVARFRDACADLDTDTRAALWANTAVRLYELDRTS